MKKGQKLNLLCICYNSQESIYECLSSWAPFVSSINILINGGQYNDYYNLESTKTQINNVRHPNKKVYTENFQGFSNTRNRLIKLVNTDELCIFIDDSFILGHYCIIEDLADIQLISIFSKEAKMTYSSNRIFKGFCNYTGIIHETIETNLRVHSGICVTDKSYESHTNRTNVRKLDDLQLLKNAKSPRDLYYLAATLFNLCIQNKTSAISVIDACNKRLRIGGDNVECDACRKFIYIIKNLGNC
jgi:hypothetical protein